LESIVKYNNQLQKHDYDNVQIQYNIKPSIVEDNLYKLGFFKVQENVSNNKEEKDNIFEIYDGNTRQIIDSDRNNYYSDSENYLE
jgi:hypothetical protein